MSATQRVDLHVEQGADYSTELPVVDDQGRPRTLLGWVGKAAVRHSPTDPLVYTPDVVVRPGSVRLVIPGIVSAGWVFRRAVFEVLLVGPQGQRERLATGRVLVDPSLIED